MLFGVATLPLSLQLSVTYIGILLHKQATRTKYFDGVYYLVYRYNFAGNLKKTLTPYVGFLLQNIG